MSDYSALKKAGIVHRIIYSDRFLWTKSKTSLAEYFKWLGDTYTIIKVQGGFWEPIESVFVVDGQAIKRGSLSHLANSNGNYAKKESKDFAEIKSIIEPYRESIKHAASFGKIKGIVESCNDDDPLSIDSALKKIAEIINTSV
ncbi:MAG: hypothetical protein LBG57_12115 [Treponema sp.]|jgi:hypothetical protein|nr:hypothetical protein [Treponema sp.]